MRFGPHRVRLTFRPPFIHWRYWGEPTQKMKERCQDEASMIRMRLLTSGRYDLIESGTDHTKVRSRNGLWDIHARCLWRNGYLWSSTEVRGLLHSPNLMELQDIKNDLLGTKYAQIRYRFYDDKAVGHILHCFGR